MLHSPEIPDNTGNIGRTCMATGTRLHLIEPLGFRLSDRALKRAGMDYWKEVDCVRYMNYEEFLARCGLRDQGMHSGEPSEHTSPALWYLTTKAERCYSEVSFGPEDYLMFGRESGGIPEEILADHKERCIRIPMRSEARSLNLANSVAVVLYEALRQNGFSGLEKQGALHHLSWK